MPVGDRRRRGRRAGRRGEPVPRAETAATGTSSSWPARRSPGRSTNLRAYENERARAAELAALDQAKTNFFSNVSHEFRTPLTLILGPLEDLLDDPELPAEQRERLLPMQRNGLRLLKLVNTVLDFSRLESGRLRAAYRPTDLADYTPGWPARSGRRPSGPAWSWWSTRRRCPRRCYVDREMWEKIVLNLLSNAVKFTPAGRIEVRVSAADGQAVLTVRDTGVGLPADERELLFDRFHRVTGAWSRSHEGTGIGLALVRELAELHGGSVAADSEVGRGSVFTVRIPFGTSHLPPERISEAATLVVSEVDAPAVPRGGVVVAAGRSRFRRRCRTPAAAGSCSSTTTPTCATTSPGCCARTGT